MVIRKNEEVSVGVKQSGLIKNDTKERKKDKKNKDNEETSSLLVNDREMLKDNSTIGFKSDGKEESSYSTGGGGGQQMDKKKKKKKEKKKQKKYDKIDKEDGGIKSSKRKSSDEVLVEEGTSTAMGRENLEDVHCVGEGSTKSQGHVVSCNTKQMEKEKKKRKKYEKMDEEDGSIQSSKRKRSDEVLIEGVGEGSMESQGHAVSHNKKQMDRIKEVSAVEVEKNDNQNKRKKAKSVKDVLVAKAGKGDPKRKRTSEGDDQTPNSKTLEPSKRVRFSGHVEVFPSPHATDFEEEDKKMDLVQGKRFSREEDEMIKTAVSDYIKEHELGEEGVNMILNCKNYPKIVGCWKEIAAALPWRTHQSVYYRGHVLFERDEKRKWTEEECELIRRVHEKHGAKWKMLADVLGKHRFHVKDKWRRIKLPNMKRGHWSQEEYQTLFDLVNMDLRMRAFEEKKSKHGMLRDNICWEAISEKLSTRTNTTCCLKWYGQLTSSMVAEGLWADADDYHLLQALYSLDACCVEDVNWDFLLDHRPGDVSRKRWNQMVSHIGEHGCKSFAEQVEVLSKRYCPELLELREAFDSRPASP